MLRLVYHSKAVYPFAATELNDLFESSRAGNLQHGVRGLLFYSDGAILQLVEGPDLAVERLLGNLRRDCRHRDMQLLLGAPGIEPYFVGCAMVKVSVGAIGPLEELTLLTRAVVDYGVADGGHALTLLKALNDDRDWVFRTV